MFQKEFLFESSFHGNTLFYFLVQQSIPSKYNIHKYILN